MSYRDLVHPDELQKVSHIFSERMAGNPVPLSYETIIVRKNDEPIPIEVSGSKIFWHGQPAVMVVFRDISLRKRFEEALLKSHNDLEHRVQERTNIIMEVAEKLEENQRELLG